MNTNQLKGKLNQLKGETKIWFGKKIGNRMVELSGRLDKTTGVLQEQKEILKSQIQDGIEHIEEVGSELNCRVGKTWEQNKL